LASASCADRPPTPGAVSSRVPQYGSSSSACGRPTCRWLHPLEPLKEPTTSTPREAYDVAHADNNKGRVNGSLKRFLGIRKGRLVALAQPPLRLNRSGISPARARRPYRAQKASAPPGMHVLPRSRSSPSSETSLPRAGIDLAPRPPRRETSKPRPTRPGRHEEFLSPFRQRATATHPDTSRAIYCLPRPALCAARCVGSRWTSCFLGGASANLGIPTSSFRKKPAGIVTAGGTLTLREAAYEEPIQGEPERWRH
jgi:hypothetical protein